MNGLDLNSAGGLGRMRVAWDDERPTNDTAPDPLEIEARIDREELAAATPASVLAAWAAEGPMVHEPTGLDTIDEATDGGPVYGSRWYVSGAPDAGKTALEVQILHGWARRGIAVGLLAVDEEPGDIVTRLVQREGFTRSACERRDPGELGAMQERLAALPIRLYDGAWTIERAAADLAAFAAERGARAALGIDSLQTVRCAAEDGAERELSPNAAVEMRVRAVRAVASEHRLIALATSEMSRAGYRSKSTRDQIDPMAASKWSGAIEYSARVLLSLRSVPGVPNTIEIEIPKNKHGRGSRRAADGEAVYLEIDRPTQTLREVEAPPVPDEGDRAAAREAAQSTQVEAMAESILAALVRANAKGLRITGQRELRALVSGGGSTVRQQAVSLLIASGRIEGGNRRPFVPRYPDASTESEAP